MGGILGDKCKSTKSPDLRFNAGDQALFRLSHYFPARTPTVRDVNRLSPVPDAHGMIVDT